MDPYAPPSRSDVVNQASHVRGLAEAAGGFETLARFRTELERLANVGSDEFGPEWIADALCSCDALEEMAEERADTRFCEPLGLAST